MEASDIFVKGLALARLERAERQEKLDQIKAKWAPMWQTLYYECFSLTGHQFQDFEEIYTYCEFCGYSQMIGDEK